MERFKFKTRGMQSPQGMPKVFFCCHPKDFDRFFENISDEILAKQNCAVFYDSTPDAERDEQFYFDLKQMQLFVMPVTSELLYIENTALSELFPFAIENHIPVLPIMQESGLEQVFNEKCGDLQYLDKTSTDITAISYDEKLEKYLSSVLIGDEMAEKIRNAFDAYVFLSYRKKDRKYAQELMKLIHKNDFCRDIAIWYDEFLTPGENFNDSIKAAFEKSGLFVLAVTPNLVNEVNYVMTTEYPMAKEAGKPILPAELVETDKSLLAEKYEGIPDCTDAYNDAELSAALLDSIKHIAIKANDNSPEHNFFIGLAYLGGVDVEVDYEKALELITFAAENNLVEAIEKLVEIYRIGYGVERDYFKAIEWQEKLIEIAKEEYRKDDSELNYSNLFWSIMYCGKYYEDVRKLSKAKEKYVQAKLLFEGLVFDEHTYNQNRGYSVCCVCIGNVFEAEADFKSAREYYEKSLEIVLELLENSDIAQTKNDLSVCYNNIGNLCIAEGNLNVAEEYYKKSLDISIAFAEEVNTVDAKLAVLRSYIKLGDICKSAKQIERARDYYGKSIYILLMLGTGIYTTEKEEYQSIISERLGNISFADGKIDDAKKHYENSLALNLKLLEKTDTVEAKRRLWVSYSNLFSICQTEGDSKNAKKYCDKAFAVSLELAELTRTIESRRNLLINYNNLGDIYYKDIDFEAARKYYEKAFEIALSLANITGALQAQRDLVYCYKNLGKAFNSIGKSEIAIDFYKKSLEINCSLLQVTGELEERINMCHDYENISEVYMSDGNLSIAKEYCKKAFVLHREIFKETEENEAKRELAWCCAKLGDIYYEESGLEKAQEYYKGSYAFFVSIATENNTVLAQIDLWNIHIKLGDVFYNEKALDVAKDFYIKALKTSEKLLETVESEGILENIAISYHKISLCDKDNKKYCLKKVVFIYESLVEHFPDDEHYRLLLDTFKHSYDEVCSE